MTNAKTLSHSSPIWPVKDMKRSLDFYENMLGFKVMFKWEDPPTYATVKRDDIGIHLALNDDLGEDYQPKAALFIFAHDVDAVWQECSAKDIKILSEIADRDYGMRDFDIEDPDGYRIVFGRSLDL